MGNSSSGKLGVRRAELGWGTWRVRLGLLAQTGMRNLRIGDWDWLNEQNGIGTGNPIEKREKTGTGTGWTGNERREIVSGREEGK